MSFKDEFPDFKSYRHDVYKVEKLPRDFLKSFQGYISAAALNEEEYEAPVLRQACDIIAKNLNKTATTNSGLQWLRNDLHNFIVDLINEKRLNRVLDAVQEIVLELEIDVYDINEELEEINFGYLLEDSARYWCARDGLDNHNENVDELIEEIPDEQENVLDHLRQARKHILELNDERSRKDALRDVGSAIEAQLAYITGEEKMGQAIKKLNDEFHLAPEVTSQIKYFWDHIHKEKDIRHGARVRSDSSEAEILYWIEHVIALMNYVQRELN